LAQVAGGEGFDAKPESGLEAKPAVVRAQLGSNLLCLSQALFVSFFSIEL
jgi:hypothetical protein